MAAPIQKGTSLLVGIGGYTYTSHIVEDANPKPKADIEVIKDEDNATSTKIITDPGKTLKLSVIAKAASTIEDVKIGDTVTIKAVAWMVHDVDIKRSRGALKATLDLVKEDSMTYT